MLDVCYLTEVMITGAYVNRTKSWVQASEAKKRLFDLVNYTKKRNVSFYQ